MHPVKLKRQEVGFSVKELAEYTGLATSTISGIENGTSEYKTNRMVAELLADAFDCPVRELFTPDEISHRGRPPLTGTPISQSFTITWTKQKGRTTDTFSFTHERQSVVCGGCNIEMPLTDICPDCTN